MSSSDVQQADADLWLAYGVQLKNAVSQSSSIGPNNRFYIAPLSAAGIAAGKNINVAIQNNGVFTTGDTLLDLDQPVFLPSRQSYFQRMVSYANSVELHADNNTGAQVRYNDAQIKAQAAQTFYTNTKIAAQGAYKAEVTAQLTTLPFSVWVVQNYPQLAAAQNANAAASANLAAASAAMSGPMAAIVGQYQSALTTAGSLSLVPGFNMDCSPASADQIAAGQAGTANATLCNPTYQIDAQYPQLVDSWIATFPQNKKSPKTFTFTASDAANSSWSELGYSNNSVQVTGSYCIFFSATFTENNTVVTKNLSAEELGSDLEVTITATDLGSFNITPGSKWNPGQLAGMPLVANADPNLSKPMAFINQAVLAYGVGMQVNLSSSASSMINNYLEKAQSTGGSASIFGFNIGLGGSASSSQTSTTTFEQVKRASSGTSLVIPPADNAYPTLLAAFGQAIPLPGTALN
ncbi:hypothetical protein FSOLCH5_006306 [Fusarium solani]|uniref:Uncharacterized protein n=1 Tax=Fusarium solani TaxID=169388 RepID=A0A9P9L674_FUSSL|nr:uncharacterized protein B0J15DRAFT_518693 [Fusarium solani]KAH7274921.1 hypothetical protein B0J15DRAFT_518693 [Fusarium solani]KAJ3466174.1 hypothetical protein MRS44_006832 [Fusarium solani]KAJ4226327.1 hypothetical protein NW759_004913 [Fusarium solani]